MEELLDDDDEVKVEKSNVEKMEKHKDPESRVLEPRPAGIGPILQSLCLLTGIYNLPVRCSSIHQTCIKTEISTILFFVHKCSSFFQQDIPVKRQLIEL